MFAAGSGCGAVLVARKCTTFKIIVFLSFLSIAAESAHYPPQIDGKIFRGKKAPSWLVASAGECSSCWRYLSGENKKHENDGALIVPISRVF